MVPGPRDQDGRPGRGVQSDATHALVEDSDLIRRHAAALHLALMLADAITAIALFIGLSMIRFGPDAWQATWATAGIDGRLAALLYGISLVAVLWIQGLYRLRVRWSRRREALDVLFAVLLLAVVVFTALFLFNSRTSAGCSWSCSSRPRPCSTIAGRNVIRVIFLNMRASGRNTRYMLIVGANPPGRDVRRSDGPPHRARAGADRPPRRARGPGER